MSHDSAIFLSDAHLGISIPGAEQREQALVAFIKEIHGQVDHLFLLGDIFDFWIEYRHAVRPDYFHVLFALRNLRDSGVKLHYLPGNHDFALGPVLSQATGMILHGQELDILLQGKRLLLSHGDRFVETGPIHSLIFHILRNRRNQRLFKLLHPNIGIPLAKWISGLSRRCVEHGVKPNVPKAYQTIGRKYLDNGFDMVILGHTHFPDRVDYRGKVYVNTGEWIKTYSYAELKQGQLRLWEYLGPGRRRQISNLFPLVT